MRALCFAAIALAFAVPASAHAASAGVGRNTLTFEAGPGEANQVSIATAPEVFRIADAGAAIVPGVGCRSLTPQTVECERRRVELLIVRLGDGSDTVSASVGIPTRLNGGDGNDLLEGTEVDDILRGGPAQIISLGVTVSTRWRAGPGPIS